MIPARHDLSWNASNCSHINPQQSKVTTGCLNGTKNVQSTVGQLFVKVKGTHRLGLDYVCTHV